MPAMLRKVRDLTELERSQIILPDGVTAENVGFQADSALVPGGRHLVQTLQRVIKEADRKKGDNLSGLQRAARFAYDVPVVTGALLKSGLWLRSLPIAYRLSLEYLFSTAPHDTEFFRASNPKTAAAIGKLISQFQTRESRVYGMDNVEKARELTESGQMVIYNILNHTAASNALSIKNLLLREANCPANSATRQQAAIDTADNAVVPVSPKIGYSRLGRTFTGLDVQYTIQSKYIDLLNEEFAINEDDEGRKMANTYTNIIYKTTLRLLQNRKAAYFMFGEGGLNRGDSSVIGLDDNIATLFRNAYFVTVLHNTPRNHFNHHVGNRMSTNPAQIDALVCKPFKAETRRDKSIKGKTEKRLANAGRFVEQTDQVILEAREKYPEFKLVEINLGRFPPGTRTLQDFDRYDFDQRQFESMLHDEDDNQDSDAQFDLSDLGDNI